MKEVHPSIREFAVLQEATEMVLSSMDLDTVLHHILLIVRNYFGASKCAVFLVDGAANELYCRAQNGYDEETARQRLRIGEDGAAGWVAHTRTPLYIPDSRAELRHRSADPAVRSQLALPLLVRDQAVGVLDIASDQPDPFSEEARGLLAVFAGQAAIALENARLYCSERRRMRQIEVLNLIARSAAAASHMQQFLGTLAELMYDTFEGTQVAIVLYGAGGELSLAAHAGGQEPGLENLQSARRFGVMAEALARRATILADDLAARPGWPACFPGSGCELCAPLISFGQPMGAVVIAHIQPHYFNAEDRAIAQAAADVCATAAKNVQLAEELRRVVNVDSLTGAYNQRYFHAVLQQELARARRYGKRFALAMLDLRQFRQVNQAIGLEAGDELLRKAAQSLQSQLRSNDVLCRYVGDRFALVLPEIEHKSVDRVLNKLQRTLGQIHFPSETGPRSLAASFGAVQYPEHGESEPELIKALFARLEAAKQRGSAAEA